MEYPGVKIYRFCSPLFYLNVDSFKEKIIDSLIISNHDYKALILDFGGMPFIDKTGIDVLIEVIKTLQTKQIHTCLANCPHHIIRTLKNANFFTKIQHSKHFCKLYPTIHDAVINHWWKKNVILLLITFFEKNILLKKIVWWAKPFL